jgi:hypothetical protein
VTRFALFAKNEVHGKNEKYKSNEMIHTQFLCPENHNREDCKDRKRNDFLDYLQLDQGERTIHSMKSDPVGGNLKAILKECNTPAYQNQ